MQVMIEVAEGFRLARLPGEPHQVLHDALAIEALAFHRLENLMFLGALREAVQ